MERTESVSPPDSNPKQAAWITNYIRNWNPAVIVFVGFLASLLAAAKITCFPVMANALQLDYGKTYDKYRLSWIGQSYASLSLLLIPLMAGVIDISGFGYRVFVLVSGFLHLIGCLASSGVYSPGYLFITDSIVNSVATSLLMATVILVVDEYYPLMHPCRVMATTLAQGQIIGMFFFADAFSAVIIHWGWRTLYTMLGILCFCLSMIGFLVFKRRDDDDRDIITDVANSTEIKFEEEKLWTHRILGLTAEDIESCHTLLFWLIERGLVEWIQRGTFLYLLSQSEVTESPYLGIHITTTPELWMAFMFSVGGTLTYFSFCLIWTYVRKHFLIVYAVAAGGTCCSFIIWKIVRINHIASIVLSFIAGCFVGMSNTFAYAASEEATGIPGRRVYPFTKIPHGLAVTAAGMVGWFINNDEIGPLAHETMLPLYALVGALDLCVIIIVIHRSRHNQPISQPSRRRSQYLKLQ